MQMGTSEAFVALSQKGLQVAYFDSREAAKRFQEKRAALKVNIRVAKVTTIVEEVE